LTGVEQILKDKGIILNREGMPRHIAIIMDGNGRWATGRGMPRALGHTQGYLTVRTISHAACELGLDTLTLYAFSTENWRRPKEEVDALMALIEKAMRDEVPSYHRDNIRLMVSGCLQELPQSLQNTIAEVTRETSKNTGLVVNLAINYGGRREILEAAREAAKHACAGEIEPAEITEEYFSGLLYTRGLPDPDLLIRTAGELRVSNFLLWQIAYSELWVTETLWPDFEPADLIDAIMDYQKRTRKFGKVVQAK